MTNVRYNSDMNNLLQTDEHHVTKRLKICHFCPVFREHLAEYVHNPYIKLDNKIWGDLTL